MARSTAKRKPRMNSGLAVIRAVARAYPSLAICLVVVACSPNAVPVSHPTPKKNKGVAETELHQGPVTDYVAAAGLRWLVNINPSRLLSAAPQQIRKLVSDPALHAFSQDSAIDLQTTSHLVIAKYAYSTVYVVRRRNLGAIRKRFVSRLVTDPIVKQRGEGLVELSGVSGATPMALLTIEPNTALFSIGSRRPTTVAAMYARRRLSSPSVLHGVGLKELAHAANDNAAVTMFFLPGNHEDDRLGALSTRWLGLRADIIPSADRTKLTLTLWGDWEPSSENALSSVLTSVRDSAMGELLAWPEAASPIRRGGLLKTSMQWDTQRLIDGLVVLLRGELTDLAGLALGRKTAQSPTTNDIDIRSPTANPGSNE